jgi:hypothetical protein
MNQQAKIIIAGLGAVAVALGVALTVSFASGNDIGMSGMTSGDPYMGMMQSMGNMDSDAMLEHMREILGEDGYQRMLAHMADHRNNAAPTTGPTGVDDIMHRMMDGIMQQMPADSGGNMPMSPR